MSSKLVYSSHKDFELNRKSKDFPELHDFIKHIEVKHKRCQALEVISNEVSKPMRSARASHVATSETRSNTKGECRFCRNKHFTNKCYKFLKLTVMDRRRFVEKSNLCFLCLSPGHFQLVRELLVVKFAKTA